MKTFISQVKTANALPVLAAMLAGLMISVIFVSGFAHETPLELIQRNFFAV